MFLRDKHNAALCLVRVARAGILTPLRRTAKATFGTGAASVIYDPVPNLLSQLTKDAQARLLEELNYLNLGEFRGFCSDRGIPYRILAEYPNGKMKTTKDMDRKPIVLARIRHYLATGKVGRPTCIPAEIVRHDDPPARPGPRDRLYYRWYSKEHTGIMRSLGDLTDGRFRDGAVARVVAMDFWTHGEAPTLEEFARAWTQAKADEHQLLTAEYAYLTDLKHKRAGSEWKSLRKAKAESALQTLARIAPLRGQRSTANPEERS
jgi:hypothetical protein